MIPFIPAGLTYNDLLEEFVGDKYVADQHVQTVRTIKATFKKHTGYSINTLVDGYTYQEVIDGLSNAKIPHCTFAAYLRKYEWKTGAPVETEPEESAYPETTPTPVAKSSDHASELSRQVLEHLESHTCATLYAPVGSDTEEPVVMFYNDGNTYSMGVVYSLVDLGKGAVYLLTKYRQQQYIACYCAIGYTWPLYVPERVASPTPAEVEDTALFSLYKGVKVKLYGFNEGAGDWVTFTRVGSQYTIQGHSKPRVLLPAHRMLETLTAYTNLGYTLTPHSPKHTSKH